MRNLTRATLLREGWGLRESGPGGVADIRGHTCGIPALSDREKEAPGESRVHRDGEKTSA